eukprot:2585718-Amphidinium_carterae.1
MLCPVRNMHVCGLGEYALALQRPSHQFTCNIGTCMAAQWCGKQFGYVLTEAMGRISHLALATGTEVTILVMMGRGNCDLQCLVENTCGIHVLAWSHTFEGVVRKSGHG